MTPARAAAAFAELQRTAALVRIREEDRRGDHHDDDARVAAISGRNAGTDGVAPAPRSTAAARRARRSPRIAVLAVALAAAGTALLTHHGLTATADATADQDLFSLTNQDRASNGLPALLWHSTLSAIGENKPYTGCGFTVDGRSYDMIQRNYFAHPILNCNGQLVFNMMSAFGINYRAAGENIGWDSGAGDAAASASYINQQFMNSTEHRDNILDPAYTHLGIGSDLSPPGDTWTGTSPGQQNVWMFSEEFAQLASATPAPPPATPRPAPRPTASTQAQPASTPPPGGPTPAATVLPAPTPLPTTFPTSTPIPLPNLAAPQLPLVWSGGGLLADSVESVLEAFLVG